VIVEHSLVAIAQPLEQARGTLDVSKEKRNLPLRQPWSHAFNLATSSDPVLPGRGAEPQAVRFSFACSYPPVGGSGSGP
jgi:hypothetical protein